MGKGRVLVADDSASCRSLVRRALEDVGFEVAEAPDGLRAIDLVAAEPPDAVVLDLHMPGAGGLDVLQQLRTWSDVPVLLFSGAGDIDTRVRGLEQGADDFIPKPFDVRELTARVTAAVRRSRSRVADVLEFGPLRIERTARRAWLAGEPVTLAPREFDLLAALASSPGTVRSRDELLRLVWGSRAEWQDPATVTEHVYRVRQRLRGTGTHPWITAVRGRGYRFDPPA